MTSLKDITDNGKYDTFFIKPIHFAQHANVCEKYDNIMDSTNIY